MAVSGTHILEHRLVMELALGRPLSDGESVHHLNGDRLDNRPSNLELWKRPQPTGIRAADARGDLVPGTASRLRDVADQPAAADSPTPHPADAGAGRPLADIPTLDGLRAIRDDILRIAREHDASNVRVFGSVARGDAGPGSDVDLLVDLNTDRKGFRYFGLLDDLRVALEGLLDRRVDVSTGIREPAREHVAAELVQL